MLIVCPYHLFGPVSQVYYLRSMTDFSYRVTNVGGFFALLVMGGFTTDRKEAVPMPGAPVLVVVIDEQW